MTDTQNWDALEFNEKDFQEATKPPARMRTGEWYEFKIGKVRRGVAKSGSMYVEHTCYPVDADNNPVQACACKHTLYAPVLNVELDGAGNKKYPEHSTPNTWGFWGDFLNAVTDGDCPQFPRRVPNEPHYRMPDGTLVSLQEGRDAYTAVKRDITKISIQRLKGATDGVGIGESFYGKVEEDKNQYPVINRVRREEPEDAVIRREDFTE